MWFKKFSQGIFLGTLIGVGLVLVGTSKSSRELRKELSLKFEHLLDIGRKASEARRAELEAHLKTLETKGLRKET